jgi:virginiamycin B lyase
MSLFLFLALAAAPGTSPAVPDSVIVPIKEWNVPWEKTRPRDPAVAPDGKIFFVGQVGNYIARLDPASG